MSDRSAIMRAVRSKDTGPERAVRRLAGATKKGYRLNRADIPGKPDVAYIGAKKAIFIHGCFWHGHDCARGSRVPKANRDYWISKIAKNRVRDANNLEQLGAMGWQTLVVWECEQLDAVAKRLRNFLTS